MKYNNKPNIESNNYIEKDTIRLPFLLNENNIRK